MDDRAVERSPVDAPLAQTPARRFFFLGAWRESSELAAGTRWSSAPQLWERPSAAPALLWRTSSPDRDPESVSPLSKPSGLKFAVRRLPLREGKQQSPRRTTFAGSPTPGKLPSNRSRSRRRSTALSQRNDSERVGNVRYRRHRDDRARSEATQFDQTLALVRGSRSAKRAPLSRGLDAWAVACSGVAGRSRLG